MRNTTDRIGDAIFMHITRGHSWEEIVKMIPQEEREARAIVEAIRDGLFTDTEVDTFTAREFEEKANRIRIEREVFGTK